ncbi:MAG: hypothetical protein RLZZ444_513 [Pseudomonadota bacterium]
MDKFLISRLLWALVVLLAVASITFFLSRVVPADPAAFLAGQNASAESVAAIAKRYGLDQPLWDQYVHYISGLLQGNLGESMRTRQPVMEDVAKFLPATLELLLVSFTFYFLLAFALSVMAARNAGSFLDASIRLGTMLSSGVPVFWLGMTLQFVFAFKLGLLPLGGRFPIRDTMPDPVTGFLLIDCLITGNLKAFGLAAASIVLPALTIVLNLLAVGARLSRSALIDEFDKPYVMTARGKGLGSGTVLFKHVLRNALGPILTVTTMQFGYMISWVILVEVIFDWPGIGLYAYQSFQVFDYQPVIALALISTLAFSLINLMMDLLYPVIDPRLRDSKA